MRVTDAIDQYLLWLAREAQASEHTVRAYRRDLATLQTWQSEHGRADATIDQLRPDHMREVVEFAKLAGYAAATVARIVSVLRAFGRYLVEQQLLRVNPTERLSYPSNLSETPTYLDRSEVRRLLQAPKGDGEEACRDRVVLHLLYDAGLRVSEVSELNQEDLHLRGHLARIRSPDGDARLVPLSHDIVSAYETYWAVRAVMKLPGSPSRPVVVSLRGNRLDQRDLRRIVVRRAEEAGLLIDTGPHTLRNSLAAHLLQDGKSEDEVRRALGLRVFGRSLQLLARSCREGAVAAR